jgi:serine/threonine protein phosphatase 1
MDRGEDSVATVLALHELQRSHPACVFLRGNHDDEWLNEWDGARFSSSPGIDGSQQVWDEHNGKLPFLVGYWLEGTRIDYEDEYAYYVHAGLLPDESFARTPDFYKMWGDRHFLDSDRDWGKPVVFGHWQMKEPLMKPNMIGIDTRAYRSGTLTAVRLPDRQIFQVKHT